MSTSRTILILLTSLILSGCFRPDVPLQPFKGGGEASVQEVPMAIIDPAIDDTRYGNQVFLDLSSGDLTVRDRTSWDIAVEADPGGNAIILNTANYMHAGFSDDKTFGEAWADAELEDLVMLFDTATGDLDHTAIGNWQEHTDRVYLIDRGLDLQFESRGWKQLLIDSVNQESYFLQSANLDGSEITSFEIPRSESTSFTFVSLETHQVVPVSPEKGSWDLVFQYYAYRYPDGIPYWLTGALLNPFRVEAAMIPVGTAEWDALTLADTSLVDFTSDRDVIGFDWKEYLFGPPARFVTYPEKIYLLKDTEGYFFKLRFLDFYNKEGYKGFPRIEYAYLP